MKAGPRRSIATYRRGMPLNPGDKAPTFTLLNQAGEKVKLGDFKGRKVLVYFYPAL
jgi:peroxiredoxin Q/BCP